MQTIQLKVEDSSLGIVMTLIENLKKDIIKDIKIIHNSNTDNKPKSDKQKKLDQVKGILKDRIPDPMAYQRTLRDEWDRA
jgi:hypothetical protein